MKIALPSDDGRTICGHFGRAAGFLVFDLTGNIIARQTYVENNFTGHAPGHHHEHGHDHQHHSHGGILDALHDVSVVIAAGMGRRLYDDLTLAGKQVFVTRLSDAREAVEAFVDGTLDSDPGGCCHHHH